MTNTEVAVRAYTAPIVKEETDSRHSVTFVESRPDLSFDRKLVFDTETTIDRFQNLKIGYFKVYEYAKLVHQGIFFDPDTLTKQEAIVLRKYCDEHRLSLYNVRYFVDKIFLHEIYTLQTLCIGFNLPFDLSRLAIDFGYAKKKMRGGFSFRLSENKSFPRLQIKHIDNKKAFIRFTNALDEYKRKSSFRGHFLDLHTLASALTGEKLTLKAACELYNTDIKKSSFEWIGRVTKSSIRYNILDVGATYCLFVKLKEQYDLFGITLPITQVYSSASIGKECLRMMGIKSSREKLNGIADEIIGFCSTTYYGGRTENKIRKNPALVTVLDFTSMYPTMCILQKLWDFLICDHIEAQDCSREAVELLDSISLEDLRNPDTWSRLNIMIEIQPTGDILPTRSHYGDGLVWNIALNYVAADRKMWWTLLDALASKHMAGKAPKIVRATKFIPVGVQSGLRKIDILGKEIDPTKDNLFKWLIEYRQELQKEAKDCKDPIKKAQLEKKQQGLKIIANATSYGIFMQIDTEDDPCNVTVHGLSTFPCLASKTETPSEFYNPIIATLITSGARLVLAAVECIVRNMGLVHAYCDTDSMLIPPEARDRIQKFFQPLNPYKDDSVSMFKVDTYKDENDNKHELENVWFYGLSSKRYVIYSIPGTREITILKASSHGLKHLLSPFAKSNDIETEDSIWHKAIWKDILKYHYGKATSDELTTKYENAIATAKLVISTQTIMERFEKLNRNKSYKEKIKPFSFCIVGIGGSVDPITQAVIKPLAPYCKNPQQCAYEDFIDYNSQKTMRGKQYWKRFDQLFWDYVNHPEAKFDGNTGILERKHLNVKSVAHIGKESNNLDTSEVIGVQKGDYVNYRSSTEFLKSIEHKILATKARDVRSFGIIERTWLRIQKSIRSGQMPILRLETMNKIIQWTASFAS